MRLIHGRESVTAGTPAQLTSEPLRALKLWMKYANETTGAAFLSSGAAGGSGVEIGTERAEFDFTSSGRGSIDASTLYVDVSSGTQTVTWTLMVA